VAAGPLFTRELLVSPRHTQHFITRAGYVALLAILMFAAKHATLGVRNVENVSDWAAFGKYLFSVLAALQLSLVIALSLLSSVANVAQEKDRRTLLLLLMTDLRNRELVLGKLLGSLLPVLTMIGVSFPVFCFVRMFGGVQLDQIIRLEALCVAMAFLSAGWGTLVAYWKEKTFQSLSISVIWMGLALGAVEAIRAIAGTTSVGRFIGMLNPYRVLGDLLNPMAIDRVQAAGGFAAWQPMLLLMLVAVGLILFTIRMVRIWNPSRTLFVVAETEKDEATAETRTRHRAVWQQPILWKEIVTRAYGRRSFLIKLAYMVMAAAMMAWVWQGRIGGELILGATSRDAVAFIILTIVGLILVSAQSVTAMTAEQDGQTLELLLVTDITSKEFIFGKLWGVLYNSKEVLLVPLLILIFERWQGLLSRENLLFLTLGYAALVLFCSTLGLHMAISFENSRRAILNTLGTVFFLFVGVIVCLLLIVDARDSFSVQLPVFIAFIGGGAIALIPMLTRKNPSNALYLAGLMLPAVTTYAVFGFLLGDTGAVAVAICLAYLFTALAMLIPMISEFDHALGRTTLDRG